MLTIEQDDEWLPIETAPKDGTEVCVRLQGPYTAKATAMAWNAERGWTVFDTYSGNIKMATHWKRPPDVQLVK